MKRNSEKNYPTKTVLVRIKSRGKEKGTFKYKKCLT